MIKIVCICVLENKKPYVCIARFSGMDAHQVVFVCRGKGLCFEPSSCTSWLQRLTRKLPLFIAAAREEQNASLLLAQHTTPIEIKNSLNFKKFLQMFSWVYKQFYNHDHCSISVSHWMKQEKKGGRTIQFNICL